MNPLQFIAEYNYIFAIIIPIITGIAGFMITKYHRYLKGKKIKTILKLTKSNVDIILPARKGEVVPTNHATVIDTEFIAFNDVRAFYDTIEVIQTSGYKISSFSDREAVNFDNESRNLFCIGGPLANKKVASYFRKYFASVKFGIPPEKYINQDNYKLLKDFIS